MSGSIRAFIELVPATESSAGSGAGGDVSSAISRLKAGFDMGCVSFFGLVFGVVGFALAFFRKACSPAVSASPYERRLTTGHLLQELPHFERGEKGGGSQVGNGLGLACGFGKRLAERKAGENGNF